jgi:phenylalanyl-tRNA synthetase beta chain
VEQCVRSALPDLLREVVLFDVYAGERIDPGRKSVALGLILQASSQTLTDDAVEAAVTAVLDRLQSELGARLRD